jgi:outer membrane autotransporter protein
MINLMKKILLSLSFLMFAAGAFAQKNVIKVNVVGAFLQSYTLVYERVLNTKSSVQLSVGYRTIGYTINDYKYNYAGPTIVAEYRYYFTNASMDVPKGFYLAPFARYGTYNWTIKDQGKNSNEPGYYNGKYNTSTIGGGVMAGYQFLIAKRLALDLFIGPQYKTKTSSAITYDNPNAQLNASTDPFSPSIDNKTKGGIGLRTGFNIGFAF